MHTVFISTILFILIHSAHSSSLDACPMAQSTRLWLGTLEVQVGYLSSRLCICEHCSLIMLMSFRTNVWQSHQLATICPNRPLIIWLSLNCSKAWGVQCCLWLLCTRKNSWIHSISVGHSSDFGLPSVAISPWLCRKRRNAINNLFTQSSLDTHDVVATLKQRQRRWSNVIATSCTQMVGHQSNPESQVPTRAVLQLHRRPNSLKSGMVILTTPSSSRRRRRRD